MAWAQSVSAFNKAPKLPKILRLRTAGNWCVLLSVADSFGSAYWSKAARDAAVIFAAGYHDEDAAVALLTDIRTIFVRLHADRIKSLNLAQALHQLEDGMGIWSAWCGDNDDQAPHAITQGEIATLLRRFSRTELRPRPLFDLGSRNAAASPGAAITASSSSRGGSGIAPSTATRRFANCDPTHRKRKAKDRVLRGYGVTGERAYPSYPLLPVTP
jgi:Protein of unknown function (DUF3631)